MTAWLLDDDGTRAVLRAARAPVRWDVMVETALPGAPLSARIRRRIAHQIRQDIWRAAQSVRGFVPLVEVTQTERDLHIKAGGTLLAGGRAPAALVDRLAALIEDGAKRRRWMAHAGAAS